jgi:hypothetical protein
MSITNPDKIKIGMYATFCCHLDLYEIKNQDQIERILDDWDENISHEVFPTKHIALKELKK